MTQYCNMHSQTKLCVSTQSVHPTVVTTTNFSINSDPFCPPQYSKIAESFDQPDKGESVKHLGQADKQVNGHITTNTL